MSRHAKTLGTLLLAIVALFAGAAGATDPKPETNDFILRAPAAEVAGIASRNGLTVVGEVDTPTDPQGRSVYLVRADPSALPALVIDDVSSLEPAAAGIEEVFLASLPELDQSGMIILDSSAVEDALLETFGFPAPAATLDATWNAHVHDREVKDKTEQLTFEFELPADTDPANYALEVDFSGGLTVGPVSDSTSCVAVLHQTANLGGHDAEWRLSNTSASPITLDSITLDWPLANGLLVETKLGGKTIFNLPLGPTSATVDSLWLGPTDDRVIDGGKSEKLEFKWLSDIDSDVAGYSLSITTAEGHSAQFDPVSSCIYYVGHEPTISGNEVSWDVKNHSDADLILDTASITWPAANGKLLAARLDGDSLLEEPYQEFGKNADGSDRMVWQAYLNQAAVQQLELEEAQKTFQGEATVAIIDTGIDPDHPLLADSIVPGYDFINDVAGSADETADVDQSGMIILDQSGMIILDGHHLVPLNQSGMIILDDQQESDLDLSTLPPAFGHGTMVAGVVHRVAPEASIMPLKAFTANGHGSLFDIVEAIYYAVDNGANVINMSFSLNTYSPELMRAVNYAARNGVACIASAGNAGEETLVFPASFGNTIGVAATSDAGELSVFSNWGSDLVTVAAPGENILTTFPGGGWALASGTSFAAPWISGGAAIFADKLGKKNNPGKADFYLSSNALADADEISGSGHGRSGHGRANLKKAVDRVKSGRYADDRPLGTYTLSATFAEGCTASYPPSGSGSGCIAEGAGQLRFDGKKVIWTLANTGETDITLDGLTLDWPADNGSLKKIKADGEEIDDVEHPETSTTVSSGWLGATEDRTLAPHQSLEILFEFEHDVLWTY